MERDIQARQDYAQQTGLQQGLQQGFDQGLARAAQGMRKLDWPTPRIAEALDLPAAEVERLLAEPGQTARPGREQGDSPDAA